MAPDDREQRISDFWFHRHRRLDWQDRQAATARDLASLRLRQTGGSHERPAGAETDWTRGSLAEIEAKIRADHRDAVRQLRSVLKLDGELRERWLSALTRIDPLAAGAREELDALKDRIRHHANTTPLMDLGRGSIGSGMVLQDSLRLTALCLFGLAETIDWWQSRRRT